MQPHRRACVPDPVSPDLSCITEQQRAKLLEIVRDATNLLPAADAVVRACANSRHPKLARESQRLAVSFYRLLERVRALELPRTLETEVTGLLDHHRDLVRQAHLLAFGYSSSHTSRQRAFLADGLAGPAQRLTELYRELDQRR